MWLINRIISEKEEFSEGKTNWQSGSEGLERGDFDLGGWGALQKRHLSYEKWSPELLGKFLQRDLLLPFPPVLDM